MRDYASDAQTSFEKAVKADQNPELQDYLFRRSIAASLINLGLEAAGKVPRA